MLIAAPLKQDVGIFREYQKALDALVIPDLVTVDRYYVVNDCPEVIPEIHGEYEVINTGDRLTRLSTTIYGRTITLKKCRGCVTR